MLLWTEVTEIIKSGSPSGRNALAQVLAYAMYGSHSDKQMKGIKIEEHRCFYGIFRLASRQ
jgi:hypothetical protein